MDLAAQFQALVNQGLLQPTLDAPRIEPIHEYRPTRMRTAYNVGEAVILSEATLYAQLESGPKRNSNRGR